MTVNFGKLWCAFFFTFLAINQLFDKLIGRSNCCTLWRGHRIRLIRQTPIDQVNTQKWLLHFASRWEGWCQECHVSMDKADSPRQHHWTSESVWLSGMSFDQPNRVVYKNVTFWWLQALLSLINAFSWKSLSLKCAVGFEKRVLVCCTILPICFREN